LPVPSLRDRLFVRAALAALVLLVAGCYAVVRPSSAFAAAADISVIANNPPPPGQPSGQASTYTINFTCSDVIGSSCGESPTITIPLNVTSSNPNTPDPSTWAYSSSSTISGLISSAKVVGENYVITLNEAKLTPGASDTIQLSVTPPNNITPNNTTWAIQPTFQTDEIAPVTGNSVDGAATAAAKLSVSKGTSDGGSVYVVGNQVTYTITARCNPGGSTGNLYLTSGSLVDALPSYLTYVSSTPTATVSPTAPPSPGITRRRARCPPAAPPAPPVRRPTP
jgi:hypothetical protein